MTNKQRVINFQPTKKQYEALQYLLDDSTTEVLYGGSAGGGKSYVGCAWIIMMCMKYPESRWLIGRSQLKALKETTLKTFFKVCKDWDIHLEKDYTFNGASNTLHFNNGSEVLLKDLFLYPSDPDFHALGSLEIAGAFLDEVAQISIKAKEIVKSRLGWKLENGTEIKPKILYTCNPSKTWSYKEFYLADKNKQLESNKKFIPALPSDNKYLSEGRRQSLENLKGIDRKRLLLGQWEYEQDVNSLIDYDNIIALEYNSHIVHKNDKGDITHTKTHDNIDYKEKYITCDPARLGRDTTQIWIWHGLNAYKHYQLEKKDTKQVADFIKELATKENVPITNIIIDADGIGSGVVDNIRGCVAFHNAGAPFNKQNFINLKAQCYYKLADVINSKDLFISAQLSDTQSDKLREELEQVKAKDIDKDGKKQIIPKDEVKNIIGRSPDMSDSLMLRMHPIVKHKTQDFDATYSFAVF